MRAPKPHRLLGWGLLLAAGLWLAGCGGGQSRVQDRQYVLDYPTPQVGNLNNLDVPLKVRLLGVDATLDGTDMLFGLDEHQVGVYQYHHWLADPGQMLTAFILRDLRRAGPFSAVFGPEDVQDARFVLSGGVDRFQEVDGPGPWRAEVALTLTLMDTQAQDLTDRVIFQRPYTASAPIAEKGAPGLAKAMSAATAQISEQVINEVYIAVMLRVKPSD